MKEKPAMNAIPPFTHAEVGAVNYELPIFEKIEDFEVESELYIDGTKIRVRLRRQLNYKPSRFSRGPYWLDLSVGSRHVPYWGITEEAAREVACRFLLQHVTGVVPTMN